MGPADEREFHVGRGRRVASPDHSGKPTGRSRSALAYAGAAKSDSLMVRVSFFDKRVEPLLKQVQAAGEGWLA